MNTISSFVDSFIPKNIPKKKALALKEELTCHILDKVDFYKDLGFDEKQSIEKAIEDFGTNKENKNFIYTEFEQLYYENSIIAIISFFYVALINYICYALNLFIFSADYTAIIPEAPTVLISFLMIFSVFSIIVFAKIKHYRKTLFALGIINLLITVSMITNFYPQFAAYSMSHTALYLIDTLTPFCIGSLYGIANGMLLMQILTYIITLIPAIYCFIEAFKIKKGHIKAIKSPKATYILFSAIFFIIIILNLVLYPTSEKYLNNYPVWFDLYGNYITEDSQAKYDEISIGDNYTDVYNSLKEVGYISITEYKQSLSKLEKKQFENQLKHFDFINDYEIWFNCNKKISGNGFISIKHKNSIITAKAVGNMDKRIFNETTSYGAYSEDIDTNLHETIEFFKLLKEGDKENDILCFFETHNGITYTKHQELKNNKINSYYRICLYGKLNETDKDYTNRFIELSFTDGLFSSGAVYYNNSLLHSYPK